MIMVMMARGARAQPGGDSFGILISVEIRKSGRDNAMLR